jgi:hypothetical protein
MQSLISGICAGICKYVYVFADYVVQDVLLKALKVLIFLRRLSDVGAPFIILQGQLL